MGAARLESARVGVVEHLNPRVTRCTAEFRHADVREEPRRRRFVAEERLDQGTFAVDGGLDWGNFFIGGYVLELLLNAGHHPRALHVELLGVGRSQAGIDDLRDEFGRRQINSRGVTIGLLGDYLESLEVCLPFGADGVGDEISDVAMMARELRDSAV